MVASDLEAIADNPDLLEPFHSWTAVATPLPRCFGLAAYRLLPFLRSKGYIEHSSCQ